MYVRSCRANILVNFVSGGLHDEGDLSVTQNGELLSFLEDPIPSLRVGHLPVRLVLDQLDLNLPTTHFGNLLLLLLLLLQPFFVLGWLLMMSRKEEWERR